ncbi:MAG: FliM/FliN family flagellar motor switch protein [Acidobacteriia bacterium]|nr:FliM/FliN family flagellar motor switch protein [Terriglobia bacterium]
MERVLNQEEIDAMVRAARGRADGGKADQRSIKPCSFRQSGQLTGQQMRSINGLHETFARSLTQSLGAYLRVLFEVKLVSVEQLAYGEFLERVPEVTYMVTFVVPQMSAAAALQIDHSVVFPLIDVLLGGNGHCEALTREVSEIEEQIMQGVGSIICRELAYAWAPLGVDIDLEGRQQAAQMQRFLAPTEKTLCLSFEVKLAEAQGTLNLIFPVSISNTLLRKLSADWSYGKPRAVNHAGPRLLEKMMDCTFPITLGIPTIHLPIQTILTLAPQDICDLGLSVRNPASLIVAGRRTFDAAPVRQGRMRAAQVGERLPIPKEERRQ